MTTPAFTYDLRTLTGRCASGAQRDAGRVVHALYAPSGSWDAAVCGASPGRGSGAGWGVAAGNAVTCPTCLKRIAKPRAPRMSAAAGQILRTVAAGGTYSPSELDEATRRELNRRRWFSWGATGAELTPAGQAAFTLMTGSAPSPRAAAVSPAAEQSQPEDTQAGAGRPWLTELRRILEK